MMIKDLEANDKGNSTKQQRKVFKEPFIFSPGVTHKKYHLK